MPRPLTVWGATLGALVAYDVWCARNTVQGDSLSEVVRLTYRTHTPAGRALFLASWGTLTVWLVPHILKHAPDPVEAQSQVGS